LYRKPYISQCVAFGGHALLLPSKCLFHILCKKSHVLCKKSHVCRIESHVLHDVLRAEVTHCYCRAGVSFHILCEKSHVLCEKSHVFFEKSQVLCIECHFFHNVLRSEAAHNHVWGDIFCHTLCEKSYVFCIESHILQNILRFEVTHCYRWGHVLPHICGKSHVFCMKGHILHNVLRCVLYRKPYTSQCPAKRAMYSVGKELCILYEKPHTSPCVTLCYRWAVVFCHMFCQKSHKSCIKSHIFHNVLRLEATHSLLLNGCVLPSIMSLPYVKSNKPCTISKGPFIPFCIKKFPVE